MFRFFVSIISIASVAAFMNVGRQVQSNLKMGIENFIGSADPKEGGFFDPFELSKGKSDETLRWYRAAELKHGRVAMLGSLGMVFQGLDTGIIPNPSFHETNPFSALSKVYYENPGALIQIILAISAVEVLSASIESQNKDGRPGDFGWDPLKIRPKSEEALDVMQVKELKNGRLAMISVAGMAMQTYVSGNGYPFF